MSKIKQFFLEIYQMGYKFQEIDGIPISPFYIDLIAMSLCCYLASLCFKSIEETARAWSLFFGIMVIFMGIIFLFIQSGIFIYRKISHYNLFKK